MKKNYKDYKITNNPILQKYSNTGLVSRDKMTSRNILFYLLTPAVFKQEMLFT